ncbi:Hypothetical protein PHPALM_14163 [Phytophthora palmivora]|uniref:Uncharacterized protein n=1 Tax=Phytophthora palmivora TaxID=4796 RepID=A0A2P4XVF5_9STRA|nr:Hypothetical protein PHPALM_14163 [Phytophthora palmivora]
MGLDELKPGNTKRAKDTAVTAFKAFVKSEHVEFDYVKQCIEQDATGKCFVSVLDKFVMYLAFNEGKKGKPLARNTAMQYFRQSKMWLFELFPVQRHIVEAKLLSMGKTLDSFCMKRDGKVVNKAPPCSKGDLKKMMLYLYEKASTASDYQDAALLCLLLYLFGRASDLSLVRKQNLSVDAGKVFFVRFIRMKTSEEQGLSLFPDADFVTCPLHAIAMAIITQTAPTVALIDNLPDVPVATAVNLSPSTPLLEVLNHPEEFAALEPSAVSDPLTSHSFRRGADKALSGYDTETKGKALDLKLFDTETREKIADVQCLLFTTCYRMESAKYNLSQQVLDVLTAYLILHYPLMKKLQADATIPETSQDQETIHITEQSNQSKIIDHQRSVIDQLMEHIKRQDERMDNLEAKMDGTSSQDKNRKRHIWFAWYAQEARMWPSTISKQQKSDTKLLVAFMKLFLDGGIVLDTTAPDYRDRVLDLGKRAEEAVLSFLSERKITSRGAGNVLKHLRSLHRSGILNAKIERYQRLIQTAAIKGPAPGYTQDVLEVISE